MVPLPLVNLWGSRSIIFYFAILNLKIRFKSTYLGFLWAAIEPLFYFIILYGVFSEIRDVEDNFAIYLLTGVILFHVFARGTSGGLVSLTINGGIIKSLKIRKEFFPVVATIATGLLTFVDVGIFFGLMPIFHFIPSWTIILFPLPLILLLILVLGLSYILSIITVFARDVQFFWIIFVHSLLFITPIFWILKDVNGILLQIHQINPLGQLIEISHKLVIDGQIPSINEWVNATFFVLGIFFFGFIVFNKFEHKITEAL